MKPSTFRITFLLIIFYLSCDSAGIEWFFSWVHLLSSQSLNLKLLKAHFMLNFASLKCWRTTRLVLLCFVNVGMARLLLYLHLTLPSFHESVCTCAFSALLRALLAGHEMIVYFVPSSLVSLIHKYWTWAEKRYCWTKAYHCFCEFHCNPLKAGSWDQLSAPSWRQREMM